MLTLTARATARIGSSHWTQKLIAHSYTHKAEPVRHGVTGPSKSQPRKCRTFCVGGNWKMNGDYFLASRMCKLLNNADLDKNVDVIIACPSVYISFMREMLPNDIAVAAQNCYKLPKGAFTGELSPCILRDAGANWVILGHSERRKIFNEDDDLIGQKVSHALDQTLCVIACIGETLKEREKNQTEDVLAKQMCSLSKYIKDWSNVVIAYEPIWAIGSGKTATPEQAQKVHSYLRRWLTLNMGKEIADELRIQYGGSVTAKNCRELAKQPDIDGFLVGGAALKSDFIEIINAKKMEKI